VVQAGHSFDAGHDPSTTSYPLRTITDEVVTKLVEDGGIVAPTGKPGGVLMFHGSLMRRSAPNITPYARQIVTLTLNAVSNYIRLQLHPQANLAGMDRAYRLHADHPVRGRRAAAIRAAVEAGGGVGAGAGF